MPWRMGNNIYGYSNNPASNYKEKKLNFGGVRILKLNTKYPPRKICAVFISEN